MLDDCEDIGGLEREAGPDLQGPFGMQYGREFGCFTSLNGVLVKGVAWPD